MHRLIFIQNAYLTQHHAHLSQQQEANNQSVVVFMVLLRVDGSFAIGQVVSLSEFLRFAELLT